LKANLIEERGGVEKNEQVIADEKEEWFTDFYNNYKLINGQKHEDDTFESDARDIFKSVYKQGHDLKFDHSSASCDTKSIEMITFGGFSSRLWVMRMHFNSLPIKHLESLPFYAWQCVTLKLPHREVDIAFKDE
tara:strand:- start:2024 stop:2425 length:402 start_codon:yes stop_codon:yes gene_type:complete